MKLKALPKGTRITITINNVSYQLKQASVAQIQSTNDLLGGKASGPVAVDIRGLAELKKTKATDAVTEPVNEEKTVVPTDEPTAQDA